jgi:hypothetical protein
MDYSLIPQMWYVLFSCKVIKEVLILLQEMMGVLQDIELVLRSYANQPRPGTNSETEGNFT